MDRTLLLPRLESGRIHRALKVDVRAGGKGLNVARAIRRLGEPVRVLGLRGSVIGQFLEAECQRLGIEAWWTPITADQRVCTILVPEDGGPPTVVNEPGPIVSAREVDDFLGSFERALPDMRLLILSGSLPQGVPDDLYGHLVRRAAAFSVRCILDTSGKALREGVQAHPWAITPNEEEFRELISQQWGTVDELRRHCCEVAAQGIEVVIVTRGAEGSLACHGHETWYVRPPRIGVINPIGSGDAFVAGLAVSALRGEPLSEGLRLATACAAANAASFAADIPEPTELAWYLNHVEISQWPGEAVA